MSKKTWSEAVASIRSILDRATSDQQRLIDYLGIEIPKALPQLVVAAKLRDHLADAIALPSPTPPGARTLSRIEFLKEDHDGNINPQSNSEAEAWVDHLRLLRRVENLEKIKIEAGDVVEIPIEGTFAEISSIGEEGRVYFKGGYGAGSWPDLLTVRARRNDNSPPAKLMREKARNYATQAAPIGSWSEAKHKEFAEYETKDHATLLHITDAVIPIVNWKNMTKQLKIIYYSNFGFWWHKNWYYQE